MISDRVMQVTREILTESLGVSEDEITLGSYLVDELGAESIDFLDIFHLAEVKLGIRISETDIAPQLRLPDDAEAWEADVSREFEPEELDELRQRLPPSTHDRIVPGLRTFEIIRLMNVEVLAIFLESKLEEKRQAEALEA